jgi:hypothetical protein
MLQFLRGTILLLVGWLALSGCATSTTISFAGPSPRISDGPTMVESWDEFAAVAEIIFGLEVDGRSALEIAQPYGNTLLVWHFTELEPEEPVAVTIDVFVDAVANESWFEVVGGPGLIPANAVGYERLRGGEDDGYLMRWGSDGAGMGTTTDGWATVTNDRMRADAAGNFTVGISTGHWSNNPEIVSMYVGNLTVVSR